VDCLSWMVFAMVAGAQPAITTNGIVNAASSAPVGLPELKHRPGVDVLDLWHSHGSGFEPAPLVFSAPEDPGWCDCSDPGRFGAHGRPSRLYVGPTQINAILPSATAVGTATATGEHIAAATQRSGVLLRWSRAASASSR